MIYGKLMGGFGNQLFIYAFSKALANQTEKKVKLIFPETNRKNKLNHFKLDSRFNIIDGPFSEENVSKDIIEQYDQVAEQIEKYSKKIPFLGELLTKKAMKSGIIYSLDKCIDLNYEQLSKMDDIIFCGYFQSNKYFEDLREQLVKEINITYSDIAEELDDIKNTNSVCLHIRRGDYLSETFKKRFFVCTDEYYEESMKIINKKVDCPKFYVFSDDLGYVQNEMKFMEKFDVKYVCNKGEDADLKDFMLMKACKHFIISNSSFSWWAQYLCDEPQKNVIAPSKWFNGEANPDFYLDYWDIVKV